MRYFGNGGGRDSYIIDDWGGVLQDRRAGHSEQRHPMLGRLPDMEMVRMMKALKGDQMKRLVELKKLRKIAGKELYPSSLSPKRNRTFSTMD